MLEEDGRVVMTPGARACALRTAPARPAGRLQIDPNRAESGLAKLVLTVVELLRQLLEGEAIRQVEAGALTDEQVERLGAALLRLGEKIEELKQVFGLGGEELNLDLGPLGKLVRTGG